MECGIRPTTVWPQTAELFPMAWRSADLVHCNSEILAAEVRPHAQRVSVWSFGYEDTLSTSRSLVRDVDVLFPARASATNYSHHVEFMAAVEGLLRVVMTDPTSFLRRESCALTTPTLLSRFEYERLLHRSKVVVGLTDNGYGGYAFLEAVAAGACPVALRSSEYVSLLTDRWPYYCTLELSSIRGAILRALETGWAGVNTKTVQRVHVALKRSSYSQAWTVARKDLEALS